MTLKMADSIDAANLPDGFDAYAGYVGGSWPDFEAEVKRFPGKHVLSIAPEASYRAKCLDVEFRDATPEQAPGWVRTEQASGNERPWIYASISVMQAVVFQLHLAGIPRSAVILWSAHYGWGPHICGPHTCAYQGTATPQCDATQYTDAGAGLNGSQIDESLLEDYCFGATPAPAPAPAPAPTPTPAPTGVPTWQEDALKALGTVKTGDTGAAVKTVQGLCEARGYSVGPTGIDGHFGADTKAAVEAAQKAAGVAEDGVVGPLTWPALLGVN